MSNLLVFTADYGSTGCELLRRSCGLYDIDLVTYGDREVGYPGHAVAKIQHARDFLVDRDEPFVLFTDGHDSIVTARVDDILQRYQSIGSLILLSGEKNCFPDSDIAPYYPHPRPPFHNSPWRYICAGGWMGERQAIIEALQQMTVYTERWENDQRTWAEWYVFLKGRMLATIDAGCQIFQTMAGVNSHELSPTGENQVTHKNPCVLHWNGRAPGMGDWYRMLTNDLAWRGK